MKKLALLLAFGLTSLLHAAIPPPGSPISDFAGVISAADRSRIAATIDRVESKTSAEIFVVTVKSLDGQSIQDYSVELFNKWGIGKKKKENGLLALVSIGDRKMWITTGYGMEQVIPDGLAGEIVRRVCIPRFKEGNYSGGIADGVDQIAKFIEGSESAKEWTTNDDGTDRSESRNYPQDLLGSLSLIAFLSLFIVIGSAALGYAFSSKVGFFIVWGGMFAGIPSFMLYAWPGMGILRLFPVALAILAFIWGFKLGLKHPFKTGKKGRGGGGGWIWGGGSGSGGGWSGGGGFSSGGGGGGGGSSGGGGGGGGW